MVDHNTPVVSPRVIKCLTLGALGATAALFSDSHSVFTLTVTFASLLAVYELWRIITRPWQVRFSEILSISILLGYVVGTGIYLVYLGTTKAAEYQYWQHYGLYYDQQSLGLALAALLAASALLYAVSGWESSKEILKSPIPSFTPKAARIVWLGVLLVLLALYAGQIGYMGATTDESGRITALGALAVLITPPMVPYTLALATSGNPLAKRCLLWAALALLISVTFVLGRRYLVYVLVLSAMVLFARRNRLSLGHLLVIVLLGVIAVVALYWGFKFFMALRLAVWQLGPDADLWAQASMAWSMLGGDQSFEIEARLTENVGTRTFMLSYFAGLVGIGIGSLPTFGKELLYSLKMAVPSLLMPGKTGSLSSSPEELIHPFYGIPVFDGPNSIVVAGYDDFGFVGVALYPVVLVMLYMGFYGAVCRVTRQQPIRLFVLFALLFQLLYVEQSLTASFVALRDLLILLALFSILMYMPVARFFKPVGRDGSLPIVARNTSFVQRKERR